MTVLVGARCVDGVIIGADSMSTSTAGPNPLMQVGSDDKISIVDNRIIVAGTGSVGLGQRFYNLVENCWRNQSFTKSCADCSKHIAAVAWQDFQSTGTPFIPNRGFGFGAIMAAPLGDRAELVEFGLLDLQPEIKTSKMHFVTMGSGQILADPFIAFVSRVLWKGTEPSLQIAKFGVYWALAHAIKYAPGGLGEPIRMAVLQRVSGKWKASRLEEAELGELAEHIAGIEKRISEYPEYSINNASSVDVPIPKNT